MRRVRKAVAASYAVLIGTGLLITLCGSANAATVHRSKPRHVQGLSFQYAVPPRPPFHYDDIDFIEVDDRGCVAWSKRQMKEPWATHDARGRAVHARPLVGAAAASPHDTSWGHLRCRGRGRDTAAALLR